MVDTKISFKEINRLAVPAIFAGIVEPVISLTDIAVVGNIRSDAVEALAAVGIAGSFISAIVWIVAQVATAVSATVSQHLGAGKLNRIKTLIPQVFLISFLFGWLIVGLTVFFSEPIFRLYNAEGLILHYTQEYYRIRIFGYPLTLITFCIFGLLRGLQNTSWAMLCSVAGALVNIGLDFLLVYGVEGWIPALGVHGAAYASLSAQVVMFLMALYFFFKKTGIGFHVSLRINPNLKPVLWMTFNFLIRTIALNVAIFMANAYATGYGKNYIAVQSILMNIWLLFSFFIDGYSDAGNAIGGKLLGRRDFKKLRLLLVDLLKYGIGITLFLTGICLLFYEDIGRIFNKDEAVLILYASTFWVVLVMQPVNAVTYIYDGLFKGFGEAGYLRNTLLAATFLGFVPTLLLTDYLGLKLYGIWIAFGVWMIVRGGTLVYRFNKRYKYRISESIG